MAELRPARLITPYDIIENETEARGSPPVPWNPDLEHRAKTGTMTEADCAYFARLFGIPAGMWRILNDEAAKWIAEHKEA